MRRSVLLTSIGLALALSAGCHCKRGHLAPASYVGDCCGCNNSVPTSFESYSGPAVPEPSVLMPVPPPKGVPAGQTVNSVVKP